MAREGFDEVPADPEVDDERREYGKMPPQAHDCLPQLSVQEPMPADDLSLDPQPLDALGLEELEETVGELQRRIAVALRGLGEQRADQPNAEGVTPRRAVAALAASLELAALTLATALTGAELAAPRLDRHPALVAGLMYAAPSIPTLLLRLEQDRRLLASLARGAGERLDEEHPTPWGPRTLRRLLVEVALGANSRCAMALEQRAGQAEV